MQRIGDAEFFSNPWDQVASHPLEKMINMTKSEQFPLQSEEQVSRKLCFQSIASNLISTVCKINH